jgi:hypothetical protein
VNPRLSFDVFIIITLKSSQKAFSSAAGRLRIFNGGLRNRGWGRADSCPERFK